MAMRRRWRCVAASRETGVSSSSFAPYPQDPNMYFLPGCGDVHEEACPVVLDHAGADPTTRAPPSPVQERDRDSGEFDSAVVAVDSSVELGDDISEVYFIKFSDELRDRTPEIDTYNEMDEEELLKGKPIDELDEAAVEHKYPPELILENSYFSHYLKDDAFGWYFDFDLCLLSSLSDYQRLVLFNYAMSYAKLAGLHPIYGLCLSTLDSPLICQISIGKRGVCSSQWVLLKWFYLQNADLRHIGVINMVHICLMVISILKYRPSRS